MQLSNELRASFVGLLTAAVFSACGGNQSTAPQLPATSAQQPWTTITHVQPQHVSSSSQKHGRYRLVDLGTFGGPNSSVAFTFEPDQYIISNRGIATGAADTTQSDPNYPHTNPFFNGFGPDPYIQHAFTWRSGALEDLGALPGINSSYSLGISENSSYAAGVSTNGTIDPLTSYVEGRAVVWKGSQIADIGTFGGNESFAQQVNNRGEVVGSAANSIADPYSFYGWGTQMRAFLWRNGTARDLGTLGGPDAVALWVNQAGQIAGWSYTNNKPNKRTGVPTFHPFLWEPRTKTLRDLGTIGGTEIFGLNGLNERGEVIGSMNVAGDVDSHAFLWNGKRLFDLGTLGGPNSSAAAINNAGVVAGYADRPSGCSGPAIHAALWRNRTKVDLGVLPGLSRSKAFAINAKDQVVGFSALCNYYNPRAFLWERGSMVDLNSLVTHHSNFDLFAAFGINDRGEIAGVAGTATALHAFALIPCSSDADCGEQSANVSEPIVPTARTRAVLSQAIRTLLERRQHVPWLPIPFTPRRY